MSTSSQHVNFKSTCQLLVNMSTTHLSASLLCLLVELPLDVQACICLYFVFCIKTAWQVFDLSWCGNCVSPWTATAKIAKNMSAFVMMIFLQLEATEVSWVCVYVWYRLAALWTWCCLIYTDYHVDRLLSNIYPGRGAGNQLAGS